MNSSKTKFIVVTIENFLYGGTTTHLINLINSNKFKNFKFIIITNKNNEGVKQIKKSWVIKVS